MLAVLLLASVALLCQSTPTVYKHYQPAPYVPYVAPVVYKNPPKPYSFGYHAPAIGGSSSRQETSDGNGRVSGSYSITDADGRARVVDYYADETGFHANVQTNEPGTANQNPADVKVQSYAGPAVAPVVSPKVIAAPAPVYTYTAPVRTVVKPQTISYRLVPVYDSYTPDNYYGNYDNYYGSYAPYNKLSYYK